MNAPVSPTSLRRALVERYQRVRGVMPAMASALSAEDLAAQSMPDCSPGKWHLAHTSWFFEAMILARDPDYRPIDERLQFLFNSYYEALGERVERAERGLMTRPSRDEVLAYRAEVDRRMTAWLTEHAPTEDEAYLLELGLHHDQQHQELFVMDILNLMSRSPLDPVALPDWREPQVARAEGYETFDGGLVEIGLDGGTFAFDNEGPRHKTWLEPYALARGLVTNGDWIRFIDDGGYSRAELWLSDGWACVKANGWEAPLYWKRDEAGWSAMTPAGRRPVDPAAPVRHVSYYEADAFARWSGKRLPREAEWEHAAASRPDAFVGVDDAVWQWTATAYEPYPGFTPTPGTAAEYNGKFMANQMVLRGGCAATPPGHARVTYRNFYYPHQRWAFMGVRLADAPQDRARDDDADAAAFRADLIEGLKASPKAISPKWLYDAEGSRLFEEITRLPEYYPTRQEAALLRETAPKWAARFGERATLVEFGSGASEKTRIVLDAAADLAAYAPIDISPDALNAAADRIRADYPHLTVAPMVGDFLALEVLPAGLPDGRKVGFFPGSTIGNLTPTEAVAFLNDARRLLGPDALFVLGVDLVKAEDTLVAAYDDSQGVTAAFDLNLLVRANRDLGANFDLGAFRHRAIWNVRASRMEMHLVSLRDQTVRIGSETFAFAEGETLHTESSRKFTAGSLKEMAAEAGWTVEEIAAGPEPSVALALLV